MNHTKAKLSAEAIVKDVLKLTESPEVKKGTVSKKSREILQKKVLDHLKVWFNLGHEEGVVEGYRRGYQQAKSEEKR
jgi:hypothetical protein